MATKITVPDLGESIVEATVADWLKQEGDYVEVGEAVVVLETDKVDLDVGAESAGVLARIDVQQGEDVKIGDVLGVIEAAEKGADDGGGDSDAAVAEAESAESEKPEAAEADSTEASADDGAESDAEATDDAREQPAITPVAQRLAREHGVDTAALTASGPGGRITKQDVERHLSDKELESGAAKQPSDDKPAQQPADDSTDRPAEKTPSVTGSDSGGGWRREERVRFSRRRRTIAARLVEAQQTAAMLTTFNEVDMTAIMALRKRRQSAFVERHDVKLGIASFFIKAAVGALKAFPEVNSELQGDELVLKHYYDIGVAIGAPEGLVVPVLRDADRKSFAEIEKAIGDMAQRARDGKLSLEELRGGTFTITNGGVFGSMMSTPILNPPQVGILGLHKIEQRPVAIDGEVVIRPMMYVALSYDHRVIDGREAVQFLVRIKELVEDPDTMLLEG